MVECLHAFPQDMTLWAFSPCVLHLPVQLVTTGVINMDFRRETDSQGAHSQQGWADIQNRGGYMEPHSCQWQHQTSCFQAGASPQGGPSSLVTCSFQMDYTTQKNHHLHKGNLEERCPPTAAAHLSLVRAYLFSLD